MASRNPAVIVSGRVQQIQAADTLSLTNGLLVGGAGELAIGATGNFSKIANIAAVFPTVQGAVDTFLRNNGSGTLTWATVPGTSTTREIFFTPGGVQTSTGDHTGVDVSVNGDRRVEFFIPFDFVTLVSVAAIIIPNATVAAANIDLTSDYGASGELFNANSESDVASTFALTLNTITEVSLSTVFTALAAGDRCGCLLSNTGVTSGYLIIGVRLRYTV